MLHEPCYLSSFCIQRTPLHDHVSESRCHVHLLAISASCTSSESRYIHVYVSMSCSDAASSTHAHAAISLHPCPPAIPLHTHNPCRFMPSYPAISLMLAAHWDHVKQPRSIRSLLDLPGQDEQGREMSIWLRCCLLLRVSKSRFWHVLTFCPSLHLDSGQVKAFAIEPFENPWRTVIKPL